MITKRYLLGRPASPAPLKAVFDQQVVPAAIDAAASIEAVVERLSRVVRLSPFQAVALAFSVGLVMALHKRSPRSRPRR